MATVMISEIRGLWAANTTTAGRRAVVCTCRELGTRTSPRVRLTPVVDRDAAERSTPS